MTPLDAPMAALAIKLIGKHGTLCKFTRKPSRGSGRYDPVAGKVTGGATLTMDRKIFPTTFTPMEKANGQISTDDVKMLIAGGDIPADWDGLQVGDLITFKTKIYRVNFLEAIYSGEQIAAYVAVSSSKVSK